jgi:uncharacterized protein with HEPN domain
MLLSDRNAIGHISDACRRITSFVGSVPVADFHKDHWCLSAVAYQLIIIGEATKSLSWAFREDHRGIDWRGMAGMRDVLAHDYQDLNVATIWQTATRHVPALAATVSLISRQQG